MMNQKLPLVSAIITTKNNHATLEECLASIKNQSYPKVEIVVVDNYSTDDTLVIAKRYTKRVFTKGPERSVQRNYAVEKANGEYIIIIDSDMKLSEHVITSCVEAVAQPGVKGAVIPEESFGQGFWAQCKKLERSFYNDVPWMQAARFFAKADFERLGGYDSTLTSGEDWELSQRIGKTGELAAVEPLIFHNEGRLSLLTLMRKKAYYGQKYVHYKAVAKDRYADDHSKQAGVFARYGLFFKQPVKLFRNPIRGVGMLFMKTCEFVAGSIGFLVAKRTLKKAV